LTSGGTKEEKLLQSFRRSRPEERRRGNETGDGDGGRGERDRRREREGGRYIKCLWEVVLSLSEGRSGGWWLAVVVVVGVVGMARR